jgi:hypothetical protein
MPSFPPGSPFEEFFKQFDQPGQKKKKGSIFRFWIYYR